MNSRIHVAVGVIYNSEQDKVLITKRTAKQHLAGLWEFPGGKVEKNEDVITALNRELYEELGIVVQSAKKFTTISYDYPDKKIFLDVCKVLAWDGEPASREHQELNWTRVDDLNSYEFPDANKHIIQSILLSEIYVISQESYEDSSRILSVATEYFIAGIKTFQLRLKSRNEYEFPHLIAELIKLARKYNAKIILNGAPSDVNTYEVDGLHLNSKELMNYESRPIGEEYILGASCHNNEELAQAEKLNVNYAFISPVYKTLSHTEVPGIGWDGFYKLNQHVKFPVYALGGMTAAELMMAQSHGAYGIAMINAAKNFTSK